MVLLPHPPGSRSPRPPPPKPPKPPKEFAFKADHGFDFDFDVEDALREAFEHIDESTFEIGNAFEIDFDLEPPAPLPSPLPLPGPKSAPRPLPVPRR